MDQFEIVFGDIWTAEALLEQLYAEKQQPAESVALWSCRLSDLIIKVKDESIMLHNTSKDMLLNKFWTSLTQEDIKVVIR